MNRWKEWKGWKAWLLIAILFAPQTARAIQSPELELGRDGLYDGTVRIERDTQGRMVLYDSQLTTGATLSSLRQSGSTHGALLGLLADDHPQYLLATELNTEAELEALLSDIAELWNSNDGALDDDDLSDNTSDDLPEGTTHLYFTTNRAQAMEIETFSTQGAAGEAALGDGAGGLIMTDVATQGELDAHGHALQDLSGTLGPAQLPSSVPHRDANEAIAGQWDFQTTPTLLGAPWPFSLGEAGTAPSLHGLTDTTLSTPQAGEYLRHDGTSWRNGGINLASDVTGTLGTSQIVDAFVRNTGDWVDGELAVSDGVTIGASGPLATLLGVDGYSAAGGQTLMEMYDKSGESVLVIDGTLGSDFSFELGDRTSAYNGGTLRFDQPAGLLTLDALDLAVNGYVHASDIKIGGSSPNMIASMSYDADLQLATLLGDGIVQILEDTTISGELDVLSQTLWVTADGVAMNAGDPEGHALLTEGSMMLSDPTVARFYLRDEGAASDEKNWAIFSSGGDLLIRPRNDDLSYKAGFSLVLKNQGGLVMPNLTSAPASPSSGETYFDTTLGKLRVWTGSTWANLH